MKVKDWNNAETVLYNVLPLLIILICVSVMVLVFILLYAKKKKKALLYVGVTTILLAGTAFYLNNRYANYFERFSKLTPAIRNQRKSLFKVVYYEKVPAKVSDQAKIEGLDLYDVKAITGEETIEYIGATDYLVYFKVNTKMYKLNKDSRYLAFEEGIAEPVFEGNEYQLRDSKFTKTGFYEKVSPLYTRLVIPKNLENLAYEHQDGTTESYDFDYNVIKQMQ